MILPQLQQIIISSFFIFYEMCFHHSQATPLIGKDVILVEKNEFPYMVSLSYNNDSVKKPEDNHMCGGTLITHEHVLTAAHCVAGGENYEAIVVKVGSTDLQSGIIYKIKWWATYNDWAGLYPGTAPHSVIDNDIAIVKLVEKVNLCFRLGILTKQPHEYLYGKNATTAGWGFVEHKKRPRHLRSVGLSVHHPEDCVFNKLNLDEEYDRNLYSRKYLCTFAVPPAILGCGDSGGPLFLNKREIIGVNVGTCSEDNDPRMLLDQNMHASITFYRDFIQSVAKPGCILLAYNVKRC